MLACQGRDMVQWSPLGWERQWVLIHDEAFTIALASKEDTDITPLQEASVVHLRARSDVTLLLRCRPREHYSFKLHSSVNIIYCFYTSKSA